MINQIQNIVFLLIIALVAGNTPSFSGEIDLNGEWKFRIGDNKDWADPAFSDAGWTTIKAPGPWEDQGFRGYDGYAWYRKKNYCRD